MLLYAALRQAQDLTASGARGVEAGLSPAAPDCGRCGEQQQRKQCWFWDGSCRSRGGRLSEVSAPVVEVAGGKARIEAFAPDVVVGGVDDAVVVEIAQGVAGREFDDEHLVEDAQTEGSLMSERSRGSGRIVGQKEAGLCDIGIEIKGNRQRRVGDFGTLVVVSRTIEDRDFLPEHQIHSAIVLFDKRVMDRAEAGAACQRVFERMGGERRGTGFFH